MRDAIYAYIKEFGLEAFLTEAGEALAWLSGKDRKYIDPATQLFELRNQERKKSISFPQGDTVGFPSNRFPTDHIEHTNC